MNRSPFDHHPLRLNALAIAMASAFSVHAQTAPAAATAATAADSTLPSVTITGKTNQGSMRPGALRDDIVKTETISEKAIERSGATNINEALDKNPGISVQQQLLLRQESG